MSNIFHWYFNIPDTLRSFLLSLKPCLLIKIPSVPVKKEQTANSMRENAKSKGQQMWRSSFLPFRISKSSWPWRHFRCNSSWITGWVKNCGERKEVNITLLCQLEIIGDNNKTTATKEILSPVLCVLATRFTAVAALLAEQSFFSCFE